MDTKPKETITINGDYDLSADSLQTNTIRRENGIDQCTLVANDDKGKNYLNNLHIGDQVTVQYGYPNEGIPMVTKHIGFVQELEPSLDNTGQICKAVSYGMGYWLHQVKVNKNYYSFGFDQNGNPVPSPTLDDFYLGPINADGSANIGDWTWDGTDPAFTSSFFALPNSPVEEADTNIVSPVNNDVFGQNIAGEWVGPWDFTKINAGFADNQLLGSCHLHLVAQSDVTNTAVVYVMFSLDGGTTWNNFSTTSQNPNGSYFHFATPYDTNYHNLYNDVTTDISTLWDLNNVQLKFCLSNAGYVKISSIYFLVTAATHKTLYNIMVGPNLPFNHGLKVDFIDHVLGLCGPDGSLVAGTGYPVLNTNYIYSFNDTVDLGTVNLPYMDALNAFNELVKLSNAARIVQGTTDGTNPQAGLHWIIDIYGNIMVAPIGSHHVQGSAGNYIDTAISGSKEGWNSSITHALVVRQDMISEAFTTKICKANLVMISGNYKAPRIDDDWTDLHSLDGATYEIWDSGMQGWMSGARDWLAKKILPPDMDYPNTSYDNCILDASNAQVGFFAIEFDNWQNSLINWHYAQFAINHPMSFASLIGQKTPITIAFDWKSGGNCAGEKLRCYAAYTGSDTDYQGVDWYNYFEYDIPAFGTNIWGTVSIEITPSDIYGSGKWKRHGNLTWNQVCWIGVAYQNTTIGSGNVTNCWIDNFVITGKCILGAADTSTWGEHASPNYGCRMLTIKDAIAYQTTVGTYSPSTGWTYDDTDILAQIALYELIRNRLNITTGKVKVPLDVALTDNYMAGQLLTVQVDRISGSTLSNGWQAVSGNPLLMQQQFRISQLDFKFSKKGTFVEVNLTNDKWSSMPIAMGDFNKLIKMTDPDMQTRTYASLKTGDDFDPTLQPFFRDYYTDPPEGGSLPPQP